MARAWGWTAAACALALACAADAPPRAGIGTRVSVDRSEARVGDRIGVTVAIDTPPGHRVELPSPPVSRAFETERVERLEPEASRGGLTHMLRWTLRAREVGDLELPALEVPLVRPDGSIQPVAVGGVPLAVRSVRAELPERRTVFDIRPAPPLARSRLGVWLGAGLAVSALAGVAAWALRRRRAPSPGPAPAELARAALAGLDRALEQRDGLDARALATRLAEPLWDFVEARFGIATAAATPLELPDEVDAELRAALDTIECARFERAPGRGPVADAVARARRSLEAQAVPDA